MHPLDRQLRSQLDGAVKSARTIADSAARAALEQLGVGEPAPFQHLSETDADLRRRLRIHGRQLGDKRNAETKAQELDRLTEEVAYEHWHRMLFARFLAENNLLMYPDPSGPVAVTLQECEDLASDEGASNGWELAARFAARMLPQIFRVDSPVYELTLPPEYQQRLEKLISDLPTEVFTASDSLGWVYQFWQADNKERINKSEVYIGARELPAVTQLFTEPYMVSFLLDNALGAWWASRRLSEHDLKTATGEDELRCKAAIPGVPLKYLRFIRDEGDIWKPAAGTFDDWPAQLRDLKTLDPCCGSGHFLVSILLMLVPMRMERDGLSPREAVDAVLRENINGLEIDQRCVELAAFALALTAWKYPGAGGYRVLPELNLACSGLSVSVAKEEWKQLGLGRRNLTIALDWMHDTFRDAPGLGSLLNPAKSAAAKIVSWEELSTLIDQALGHDQTDEQQEAAVVAQGLAKAANLLSAQYNWVATNVPYKKASELDEKIQRFLDRTYPAGSGALETSFFERCLDFCFHHGTVSLVLPQNWMFLTTYRRFREKLLDSTRLKLIARLGSGAFETIGGEVVKAVLFTGEVAERQLLKSGHDFQGIDVSTQPVASAKAEGLVNFDLLGLSQESIARSPDSRILLDEVSDGILLNQYADSFVGLQNGDTPKHVFLFHEIMLPSKIWSFFQMPCVASAHFAGREGILRWEEGRGELQNSPIAYIKGKEAWGKQGIAIRLTKPCPVSLYSGDLYDQSSAAIIPKNVSELTAIWTFLDSDEFREELEKIDQKRNVTNATFVKVNIDKEKWKISGSREYPNGLPLPYSDDPTQWIFHGHPCGSVVWDSEAKCTANGPQRADKTVLQVAVARLLGFRWPAELDPEVELADEQRSWVGRCHALLPYADSDGIVCLPSVRGEARAEDRLLNLLVAAYGDAWTTGMLPQLLASSDHAGKSLDSWLRDKFFTQHCKTFQHRPFIWHVWDGLRDGFAALVNYHKLDRKALETLIFTYLGDWIKTQRDDITRGVDGAREKLAAAEALKKKLELILEGESPHDIFVRWKPLKEQPIGWDPDLNDGVRLNVRPFLNVGDVGKRGAGVLRDVPNINWNKDRGKDVESAPWFDLFKGERINDHHLTLAEKLAAREARQ
ncbi:UNVERIFIED_ORG: hypothetical protein GGI63_005249 [Rhizobium esperanzae]